MLYRRLLTAVLLAVCFSSLFGCAATKQELIDWGSGLAKDAASQAASATATVIDKEVAQLSSQAKQAQDSGDTMKYLIYTTLATALTGVGSIIHRHVTLPSDSTSQTPAAKA